MTIGRRHEFGSKTDKSGKRESFSQDINKLIVSGDMLKLHIHIGNLFPNEMVVDFNVLGSSMKHRVKS
jgi:hypothetical protein